jgi:MoaA/NifB/PqqE/SkfB family radical SAM enzyme
MSTDNKTFCILPFVHLYAEPKGEMKPCCIAGGFDEPLNLKELSLEDAFNSPQIKELRKDMMEGRRNKVCDVCYKKEDTIGHSPRLDFNKNTLWELPPIQSDFSVEPQFQHLDIRFSNLCNFKCRMCNHSFSSNWYEDSKKMGLPVNEREKVLRINNTISDDLLLHLDKIKSIYFAGGEPLIMPEHYKILKHLYDKLEITTFYRSNEGVIEEFRKRNLSIHYNTNLSVIKYDEQDLVDLWNGFYRVFLSISCDGIGSVGEYQRTGFNTKIFEDNLNTIKKYAKSACVSDSLDGLLYNFQYTTTIMNVYHIFDFINYMMDKKYISSSNQIDFYYSWTPSEYALNKLDYSEREKVINFLNTHKLNYDIKTQNEINNIISFVNSENADTDIKIVRENYIKKIDELHGGNFEKISQIAI